jgi:hypothetical protein
MTRKFRWERINLYSIVVKKHKGKEPLSSFENKVYNHYRSLSFEERRGGLEYYRVGNEFRYRPRTP